MFCFAAFSSCLDGFTPPITNNNIELDWCSGRASVHFRHEQSNTKIENPTTCTIAIRAPNSKVQVYIPQQRSLVYFYCSKKNGTLTVTTNNSDIQNCMKLNYDKPHNYSKKLNFTWDKDILNKGTINILFKGKMICAC